MGARILHAPRRGLNPAGQMWLKTAYQHREARYVRRPQCLPKLDSLKIAPCKCAKSDAVFRSLSSSASEGGRVALTKRGGDFDIEAESRAAELERESAQAMARLYAPARATADRTPSHKLLEDISRWSWFARRAGGRDQPDGPHARARSSARTRDQEPSKQPSRGETNGDNASSRLAVRTLA